MVPARENPYRVDRLDGLRFVAHEPGVSAEEVVQRFRTRGWRGSIVGPHGSGKSTLLRELGDAAAAEGAALWRPFVNRSTPWRSRRIEPPAASTVWAIDGWCHLPPTRRRRLRRLARARDAAILGTAHACGWGLPVVHRTRSTPAVLAALRAQLGDAAGGGEAELLAASSEGVRGALLALYDRAAGR
ncbi:hypothetical protein [Phycisphaera mikurensis]|uniref:AAA+ ATPase domain-containing protein n=1 Tax=Phycisphaera mikurensis (strain NBRC 102666 / KCTC 22515 / FYK2301M01) TaxID=1142394 RepID=I0ID28_PHYMF|nr:hypothetical protein [Phycisphaera mikurensis]MBB6442291.1 hypothetical protein [Phycisphaera mikurensis]BAM03166.1 hypothetical protein PSMK_10070 [Phycisphaera mikurensis NBRC 102666]